jgi:GT2 family glycosyltransferase
MIIDAMSYLLRRLGSKHLQWLGAGIEKHIVESASNPKVTILIPTRDRVELLRDCVNSILRLTTYKNFEIFILDNDSKDPETIRYFKELSDPRVAIIPVPGEFNYSKIMNSGVQGTSGELICLLNNDTLVLSPNWLSGMVSHLDQPGIGLVGSLLIFPNGGIQHAGIALGYTGVAGHVFAGELPGESSGQNGLEHECFRVSAVTFACALTSRKTWNDLGGLDESLKVGLNDVDFGIRVKSLGLAAVICTRSRLVHFESQSRNSMNSLKGFARASVDVIRFIRKHRASLKNEAYFTVVS